MGARFDYATQGGGLMQFDSLTAIWEMGGHGPFVWSAYAIAAITLIAIIVAPLQRRRRFFNEQRGIERRNETRAQSNSATDSQVH
jgi:heme exporter protein D